MKRLILRPQQNIFYFCHHTSFFCTPGRTEEIYSTRNYFMKIFIYILMALAAALLIYNFTFIDVDNLLAGDSATAVIGILCSACVILLLLILLMSRAISEKAKN